MKQIMLIFLISFMLFTNVNAACYFSPELQGVFVTQNTITNNEVTYSQVNITEDAIPILGHCHKRINNNVILMIGSEETSCFRCFHLRLVTRNVLRVHTDKDYISQCYTNEQKAIASCPSQDFTIDSDKHMEIILYKTHEFSGQEIRREYCPINGLFKLTFNIDDGSEDKIECPKFTSELDTCPSGSAMNLRFRGCSFENLQITFECLGHWEDMITKQKYLALMNTRTDEKLGPQYRCAVYDEDELSGIVTISLSNDSTCSSLKKNDNLQLNKNHIVHKEMLTLNPVTQEPWPHTKFCSMNFSNWMLGHWEHLMVDNNTLTYKDHSSFKTYTMKCIENYKNPGRFVVFSRTQCGEEKYHCIWIQQRSANILEFQMGIKSSTNFTTDICNDINFDDNRWLTQARLDKNTIISPCPVNGDFTGVIPDEGSLCAKLSSQCSSPDIMYYQVSDCGDKEVFEDREYRCLGQWEEKGLVYTYTQRRDVGTYECFVGAMISDKQIFIKEAGEHCQRNINPFKYGMELNKIAFCKVTTGHPSDPTYRQLETTTNIQDSKHLSTDAHVKDTKSNGGTTNPTPKSSSTLDNPVPFWVFVMIYFTVLCV